MPEEMSVSPLWSAYEMAAATGGALCMKPLDQGSLDHEWAAETWSASGISIDTRTLRAGDIFVALKDIRDGHDFLDAAFEAGASAALVDQVGDRSPGGAPLLVVDNALGALTRLAKAARQRNFGKRVAITGSAGKTSTKEMMRTVLEGFGTTHAADKSLNNHIGVPLTLARLPIRSDYGVFEIGMNHANEITPLSQLVRPHIAIITTVGEAHLENFDSVEGIAHAKAEIMLGLAEDGIAILPIDNEHFGLLTTLADKAGVSRIVTFGEDARADVRLLDYDTDGVTGRVKAFAGGERLSFEIGAPGKHQAMNALTVLAAASELGLPIAEAAQRLKFFGAGGGRGLQKRITLAGGRSVTILDESYNANPSSARAALELLAAMSASPSGRKIVVLGDMLELGENAAGLHAGLKPNVEAAGVAKVYTVGRLAKSLFDAVGAPMKGTASETSTDVVRQLQEDLQDGDIVMVKGSNASKVSKVVDALIEVSTDTGAEKSVNSA
ncbi:MAG: UDP-N-acetylmuramoyl-tripeptide--D-alanyl-D-alanine ligase [Pseudomonadota bacterium]